MDAEINIKDIEFVTDRDGRPFYYVFWRDIYIGSIEQCKKTKYMPPELVGKWECGYTSNEYCDTKELAAIRRVQNYLEKYPDKNNGPDESDIQKTKKMKRVILAIKGFRVGDYGPENNIIKEEFEKWCNEHIEDKKLQSKFVEDYMFFILSSNGWPVNQEKFEYFQYIRTAMYGFFQDMILSGMSIRTYRQQSDHLAMLGDDILKNRMTPGIDVSIFKDYFLQDIQKSSENPPDYHYIDKENREKRYRCTCKRLLTFLKTAREK